MHHFSFAFPALLFCVLTSHLRPLLQAFACAGLWQVMCMAGRADSIVCHRKHGHDPTFSRRCRLQSRPTKVPSQNRCTDTHAHASSLFPLLGSSLTYSHVCLAHNMDPMNLACMKAPEQKPCIHGTTYLLTHPWYNLLIDAWTNRRISSVCGGGASHGSLWVVGCRTGGIHFGRLLGSTGPR